MTKAQLCWAGIGQMCVGALLCGVATMLLAYDGPASPAGVTLLALGLTVAIAGHAVCKAACVEFPDPPVPPHDRNGTQSEGVKHGR